MLSIKVFTLAIFSLITTAQTQPLNYLSIRGGSILSERYSIAEELNVRNPEEFGGEVEAAGKIQQNLYPHVRVTSFRGLPKLMIKCRF